jgi:hypothetical protein
MLVEHSKDGMATVALARAGSVVDRTARTRKALEERVKRLSRGDDHGKSVESGGGRALQKLTLGSR